MQKAIEKPTASDLHSANSSLRLRTPNTLLFMGKKSRLLTCTIKASFAKRKGPLSVGIVLGDKRVQELCKNQSWETRVDRIGLVRHTRDACVTTADSGRNPGLNTVEKDSVILHGAKDNEEECIPHSSIYFNSLCVCVLETI